MEYRCVECGNVMKSLYVQYSPGNIRLMKCNKCKAVADEYIECEFMIIILDLILQNPKAYRHLFYNVLSPESPYFQDVLRKLSFGFLLLDGYRNLFIGRSEEKWGLSTNFSSLLWIVQKLWMNLFLGNFIFLSTFLLAKRIFLSESVGSLRFNELLLAILISSYFKLFLLAMVVWEFPSAVVFIIDLFVLSANSVALTAGKKAHCSTMVWKITIWWLITLWNYCCHFYCRFSDEPTFSDEPVITESTMSRCAVTCSCAHLMKFLVTQVLELRSY